MNKINLSDINLNLLKALAALLNEQHVSKAGDKIGVTQSAMSVSLGQLRKIYQDDLLVRGQQSKMLLTPLARSLILPLNNLLAQAESLLATPRSFNPKESNRVFHLGMSDYIALVLLPPLMQKLSKIAPHIKIVQHATNYLDNAQAFEEDKLDMALGHFEKAPTTLKITTLFKDKSIIVADKNHPAITNNKLTLKNFLNYPQVFVALERQPEENFIVNMLEAKGHQVNVALITPHTIIALQALPKTYLMTNTVERLAKPFLIPLGLKAVNTPYPMPIYHAKLYWHTKDQMDPAHQWLRNVIKEISAKPL